MRIEGAVYGEILRKFVLMYKGRGGGQRRGFSGGDNGFICIWVIDFFLLKLVCGVYWGKEERWLENIIYATFAGPLNLGFIRCKGELATRTSSTRTRFDLSLKNIYPSFFLVYWNLFLLLINLGDIFKFITVEVMEKNFIAFCNSGFFFWKVNSK